MAHHGKRRAKQVLDQRRPSAAGCAADRVAADARRPCAERRPAADVRSLYRAPRGEVRRGQLEHPSRAQRAPALAMGESQLAGAVALAVLFNVQPRLQQVLQNGGRGALSVRRHVLLLPPAPNGRLHVVLAGQLVDAGLRRRPAGRVSLHGARNLLCLKKKKTIQVFSFCFQNKYFKYFEAGSAPFKFTSGFGNRLSNTTVAQAPLRLNTSCIHRTLFQSYNQIKPICLIVDKCVNMPTARNNPLSTSKANPTHCTAETTKNKEWSM